MLISKSDILEIADILTEDVQVPGWPEPVRIRGLSAEAWDEYQASIIELKSNKAGGVDVKMNRSHMRAKLVAAALMHEHGERLFTKPEDIAALSRKSARALDFLFGEVKRISGATDEDLESEAGKSEGPRLTDSVTS